MLPLFDSQPTPPLMETVRQALSEDSAIITANARAARTLRMRHAKQQQENGIEMWPSAAIFDWDNWMRSLWQEASLSDPSLPLLLTPLQEHSLWKRVQRSDAQLVVSRDGMASLAQSAYKILNTYELHAARKNPWLELDAEHFRQWSLDFDQRCRDRNWTSQSTLENRLAAIFRAGKLNMPPRVLLIGFDRFTPAQTRYLQALREAGTIVEEITPPAPESPSLIQLRAEDAADEILSCAQWCRSQLTANSALHIGILVPDVAAIRSSAERIFRSVLMPESLNIASSNMAMPFEFSLGVPLSTVPIVKAALLLLRWIAEPLAEEEITWLLLSGFLCESAEEAMALAQFDMRQRNYGSLSPETALRSMPSALKKSGLPILSRTAARLQNLLHIASRHRLPQEAASHAYWCEVAEEVLDTALWPGFRKLDSMQFQAQHRWQRMLDEIAVLDFAGRAISYADFLAIASIHAGETIFTPESHSAPIQFVGALESSGQTFDAVWFLGADDTQWPVTGRPHPLLPIHLQRQAQTPHSSAINDFTLGYTTTMRIANSAPLCIFSYARQNKEGELRPSPLLETVFPSKTQAISTTGFRAQLSMDEQSPAISLLEEIEEEQRIASWPAGLSAGGADVLKMQAACPFQAFATKRLAARPLNRTEWGLDASARGKLLHDIMQHVWSPDTEDAFRIVSLDDLKRVIAESRLDALLSHHIDNAFQALIARHEDDAWMQSYFTSEKKRLLTRLREWMLCEARRQPFLVEGREERLSDVHVGDLKLNLRADRIDLLPDGSHLLLDYKTGEVSTAGWRGERPDEPQLPLYAVYGNVENVSGLLFAQIRPGSTGFQGRVTDAQLLLDANLPASSKLVNEPYDDSMRDGWRSALLQLADEFLHGEAAVDPKHGLKTCTYCPLPGLCRIAETGTTIEETETGDGDE